MEETIGNELEHLTIGGYIYNGGDNREGRHRAELQPNMRNAIYKEHRHLTVSTYRWGPWMDTHAQNKWTLWGLYSVPQTRRERRAGDQGLVGYLSASCGPT